MKKSILLFFCCCAINWSWSQIVDREKELLWEISGNGLKEKSYLFGTLHSNDKSVFNLADSVYVALDKVKMIVLETNVFELFDELDTRKKQPNTLYDKNGNPYTASNEASKTFYGTEDGMPQFLDAYFEEYCLNAGKKFVALETVKKQLELGSDVQINERNLVNTQFSNFTQEKLLDLYLQGDLIALDKFMRVNMSVDKNVYEKLITKRNLEMSFKLDSLLKTKNSLFCGVGAGHLAGSEGIINILRSKGYRLRPVLWTTSEIPITAKKAVKSNRAYLYQNPNSNLIAYFPGKPFEKKLEDGSVVLKYRDLGQGNTYEVEIIPYDASLSFEEMAAIYIASPPNSPYKRKTMDDGTEIFEGLSDSYPEGISWVQIQVSTNYFAVIKTYGGNKYMHSDRPKKFFDKVWFEGSGE
jgi:uncharacterized protein YbaP (TraB family)